MNRRPHAQRHPNNRSARFRLAVLVATAFLALIALVFVQAAHAGEMRTWRSAKGNYSLEAELLDFKSDGKVRLKRQNGTTIEVPLDRLSSADQQYVRQQSAELGIPAPSPPSPAKTPEKIEDEALACRTAKEAVLIYKFYLAQPNLSPEQRAVAAAKLKEWDEKVADDQVRLGKEWMTRKEADELRKQAAAKIESALEYLRLGNGELSRKTLEEASRLDPDSIQADFLMGIVYGLVDNDRKAQLHFEKCLRREPGNVSVLNNLAVSLAVQKKYPQAVQHWKTAAANAPKMKALSQNIGSLITMSGNDPRYKVPESTMKELSSLYEELTAKHGNPRPTQVGFVFTPPYGSGWGDNKGNDGGKGKTESVVVSSGSGFVVHPQVILTNEHVVKGASALLVLDPKNPRGDPLPAELIAVSDKMDLALVRCKSLDAPALKLTDKLPGRGTDIMVLGYPLGPSFGTTLKSTRGAMVAMPDPSLENMFLYDAITNPGNSGGPLCDKSGRVAGVVRAVTGGIGGTYGAGIPMSDAIPFIRKHVLDLAAVATDMKEVDWPAVDGMVSPSTVLILTKEDLRTDAIGQSKRK